MSNAESIALYHTGASHQMNAMQLFSSGLKRHGVNHQLILSSKPRIAETGVFWGIRNQDIIRNYDNYVVLERSYFKDRNYFISAGWNGLNGLADFNNDESLSDRWNYHGVDVFDWDTTGDYVLIMGQVDGDMSVIKVNLRKWYSWLVVEIRKLTDIPIMFRAHPLSRAGYCPPGCLPMIGGLEDAINGSAAVFTFNSNTGVDSILAGKPTFTHHRGSMAWDVSAHTVTEALNFKPIDREQWLYNLAYCQWTPEEIASGETWEHLCHS